MSSRCSMTVLLATVCICRVPATAWTRPVNVTRIYNPDQGSASAVISMDGAGRIHLLVNRPGQTIWSLRIEGDTRTEFAYLGSGVAPAIIGDAFGRAHAAWSQDWEIRYKRWDGGWDAGATTLSDGTGDSVKPHLCVDSSGNVHATWSKGGKVWYNRRSVGGAWDGPSAVPGTDDLEGYFPPRIAAVGTLPVILFGKHNGGNWNAWFASRESGSWTTQLLSGDAGCSNGDIDVSSDGAIHTTWDRSYHIYNRQRTGGVWGPIKPVRETAVQSYGPRVAVGAASQAEIAWMDKQPGFNDIWAGHWDGSAWGPAASITGQTGGVSPDIAGNGTGRWYAIWSRDWDIWLTSNRGADTTAPPVVGNPVAVGGESQLQLIWTNPNAFDLNKVRIVWRIDRPPTHPTDGQVLLDRPAQWGTDSYLHTITQSNGMTNYYAIFVSDAVPNFSPPANVSAVPAIRADYDKDGDVDLEDFGHFQSCLTGPAVPQTDPKCQTAKFDSDDDVDQNDWGIFQRCLTGAGIPADPNCAGR